MIEENRYVIFPYTDPMMDRIAEQTQTARQETNTSTAGLIAKGRPTRPKGKRAKKQTILLLWAEHFDAATATALITRVRATGTCLFVVGPHQQRASGEYGIAIYPDIMLDEALSMINRVACIVIPSGSAGFRNLEIEPRVKTLLQHALRNQARLILPRASIADLERVGLHVEEPRQIITYVDQEELMQHITEVM